MKINKGFLFLSLVCLLNNKTFSNENLKNETINENIYIKFINGDVVDKSNESIEKINDNLAISRDIYGIIANNIDYSEENYIISNKVFDMTNINDSFEGYNRRMYAFNTQLDKNVLYPVSYVYGKVVPKPIRKGIYNFYDNFKEVPTFVNSLLQLRWKKAANALGRFTVNSTLGVAGISDVATKMGMKRDVETMGDTLGYYGVSSGSYLILPITGPSNVRDALGKIPDSMMESGVRNVADKNLFFDTDVFDKKMYGIVRPVATGLNARSLIGFKYGDLNSPFEYDLIKIMYMNYRKIQVKK